MVASQVRAGLEFGVKESGSLMSERVLLCVLVYVCGVDRTVMSQRFGKPVFFVSIYSIPFSVPLLNVATNISNVYFWGIAIKCI